MSAAYLWAKAPCIYYGSPEVSCIYFPLAAEPGSYANVNVKGRDILLKASTKGNTIWNLPKTPILTKFGLLLGPTQRLTLAIYKAPTQVHYKDIGKIIPLTGISDFIFFLNNGMADFKKLNIGGRSLRASVIFLLTARLIFGHETMKNL